MNARQDKPPRRSPSPKQWAALVVAVLALVFILQNLAYVRVQFFLIHSTAPLWVILLVTLGAGYVIGWFARRRN